MQRRHRRLLAADATPALQLLTIIIAGEIGAGSLREIPEFFRLHQVLDIAVRFDEDFGVISLANQ